jgi:hypothetical protein
MMGQVVGIEDGSGATDRNAWARLSGLIVLAALITAIVAYKSLEASRLNGRLAAPPIYDDVAYFIDAITWRHGFESRGLIGNILSLLHQHAPFSTLVAAIGFRFAPDGYVGPYLVNAVFVLAFLLALICLTWKRPFHQVATCLIAAGCVPVLWHTVSEGRPDLPWGLALGAAAGAIVRRSVLERGLLNLVLIGAGCGLAASIKPTAFPASLALVGSMFVLRLLLDCVDAGGLRSSFRRAVLVLLCFGLPVFAVGGLLLGPNLIHTIGYIFNVFVTQRDLWTSGESFSRGLLYFLVGPGGKAGLNFWLWVGLALMALRLLLAATMGRAAIHDAVILLAAIVVAYAIPSVAEIKSYFFGASFYAIFIVAMALNFCVVQSRIETWTETSRIDVTRRRSLLVVVRLLPLTATALLFVKMVVVGPVSVSLSLNGQQQEEIRTGTDRVWNLVRELTADRSGPLTVSFSGAYPVAPATIQLYAVQAGVNLDIRPELFHRTREETEKALLAGDVLVVPSSISHTLIGPRVGDELIRALDANHDLCPLDAITFPDVTLRVYRRGC